MKGTVRVKCLNKAYTVKTFTCTWTLTHTNWSGLKNEYWMEEMNYHLNLRQFKVYTTQENFSAYLKGLSKYRRMAFFFLKYLFFVVLEKLTFFYYAN